MKKNSAGIRHSKITCFAPAPGYLQILRVMKLLFALIFVFSLGLQASSRAQSVTMSVKDAKLITILQEISKQTGTHFLYNESAVSKLPPVSYQADNASLTEVLDKLSSMTGITYRKRNNNITIIVETEKVKTAVTALQQKISANGIVTDTAGVPLYGVAVSVKGVTGKGTGTDVNGRFILDLDKPETLVFTYIGYKQVERRVSNSSPLNIVMEIDYAGLEEVVVVGFGEQKKQSMVSSVATIKGEELRMPNRNLSNNLAGQIPGLIAVQRSGEPGYDNAEFYIRGMATFSGTTSPLVLVDGVPRQLYDIEPDEIESFSILKDAAATAIYGAEGANGVVLITSKRGKVQKTSISYRGEGSILTPTRVPQYADSYTYLSLYNEALKNDGRPAAFSDEILEKYRTGEDPDLYPNSDWWSILMRDNTWNTRHTLNFRGGNQRTRFFTSGSYFSESGYYKVNPDYNNNTGLQRYNLRSNIDIDITKTTLLRVDLSGQYLKTNYPGNSSTNIFERISRIPPHLIPAVYSDGTLAQHPNYTGNRASPYINTVESGYRKEWRTLIQSKVNLDQKLDFITQGLTVRGAVSFDANSQYNMSRTRTPASFYATGRDAEGKLIFRKIRNESVFGEPAESNNGVKKLYIESALDYKRQFGKHDVNGLLLYYQKESQFWNDALAYRTQGYTGRVIYAYDNRYSIEASFGTTGSEQFAKGYRFGFFPAVGLAWNIANEAYFPESLKNHISTLKLRGSVGLTGNDDIPGQRFMYRPTFANGGGYSLGIGSSGALNGLGNGLIEGRFQSPFLSWETELKRNYGMDVTLWNGRVNLTADYFNNERSDILLQRRTISGVAGFRQSPWQNYGKMTNKGFDGSIDFRHTINDWWFSGRGNFTFARNKIIEYDEIPQVHPWMNITGTRLNSVDDMLIAERLFEESDFDITLDGNGRKQYALKEGIAQQNFASNVLPGDIKYVDMNKDGVIDDFDRTRDYFHPYIPEIVYGFGASAGYKGIYASVFFQGAANASINIKNPGGVGGGVTGYSAFMPFWWGLEESNVRQEIVDSRWTEENPSQDVFFPRLRVTEMGNNSTESSWWIKDGSFLRLKNVELGYNFKGNFLKMGRMKAARVYIMGQNVALWDKLKMYDPELGTSGAGTKYPLPSIWTAGLDVTF